MNRPLRVLVLDDSVEDLVLIREALEACDPNTQVSTVQTWADLQRRLGTADTDLIMLDVRMPATDGFAVLRCLKADPELQLIPVIVRSGTAAADDIAQVYQDHASAFILKPAGFDALVVQMRALLAFWRFNRTLSRPVHYS